MLRDPRVDPRPGDELRLGSFRYKVTGITNTFVGYKMMNSRSTYGEVVHIDVWRAWAGRIHDDDVTPAPATVLHEKMEG